MRWFLSFLAALAFACPVAAAAERPYETGILESTLANMSGENLDTSLARMSEAGAGVVKIWASWRYIGGGSVRPKPSDPSDHLSPEYDWENLDWLVREAHGRGLTVLLNVSDAPDWGAEGQKADCGRSVAIKPKVEQVANFARAIVDRYDGDPMPDVDLWQFWNEPNNKCFLLPQYSAKGKSLSPGRYRGMLNAFATAVHGHEADNVVAAGGTSPYQRRGLTHGPLDFWRKVLCLSARNKPTCSATVEADAIATHPYTNGNPFTRAQKASDLALGDLVDLRRTVRAAVRASRITKADGSAQTAVPLWVTEMSWDSRPPDTKGVPRALHARWVAEAQWVAWRSGVQLFLWFGIRDRPFPKYAPQSGFWYCGKASLADDKRGRCGKRQFPSAGDAKKAGALTAFRFPFVAYARKGVIRVWLRTPTGEPGLVQIQRKTARGWVTWKALPTDGEGIAAGKWRKGWTKGSLRAKVVGGEMAGATSKAFSLVRPANRRVSPFGCGGALRC